MGKNIEAVSSWIPELRHESCEISYDMKLQLTGKAPTTSRSPMKKVVSLFGLLGLVLLTNGCTAIQNYSLRSYQGALPMQDYAHVNEDSYGATASVLK